jgi:hypothetical protein
VGGPQRRSGLVEKREFCCTRGLVAVPSELLWLGSCKVSVRPGLKRDGPCAETRFRLSEKRTGPFESAGVSA